MAINTSTPSSTKASNNKSDRSTSTAKKSILLSKPEKPKMSGLLSPSSTSKLGNASNASSAYTPSPSKPKKQQSQEDLTQMISEQLEIYSKKMQLLILQKVTYEIPLQTRNYEDNIKSDVNSLITFRMNSIAKSLKTYFNLKLKFCLNKAGFDTNTLDLKPFLENDDDNFEMGLNEIEIQENRADYMESNTMQTVANEIKQIENTIYSHKISVEPDHYGNGNSRNKNSNVSNTNLNSKSNNGNYDHLASNHHHQVKVDVIKHLQDEMKNSTNYLMKFQSNKITETFREANHQLQLKLSQDINNMLDNLEDKFKTKFEEIIDSKTSELLDILGHPQKVSPHRKQILASPKILSSNTLTTSMLGPSSVGQKDYRIFSPSRISTHKMQIQNELEQIQDDINFGKINQDSNHNMNMNNNNNNLVSSIIPAPGLKITSPFDLQSPYAENENSSNLKNTKNVKQKIAFLKSSLNFLDEGERSVSRSRSPTRNKYNFM